jgi:F-type H+-transporting ATPase subunit delta
MAEPETIARPYAKAAFEFARDAGDFAAWSAGLEVAAEIVADARVAALIDDPEHPTEDVVSLIAGVAGERLDAPMLNFVRVLAENHRLPLLPEIASQYETERAEVENTVDVEVVSAVPLSAAQGDKLAAALKIRLKRRVRMHNSVDAALMGGAVIRAGDLVIDGSIKGRLERLATELTG